MQRRSLLIVLLGQVLLAFLCRAQVYLAVDPFVCSTDHCLPSTCQCTDICRPTLFQKAPQATALPGATPSDVVPPREATHKMGASDGWSLEPGSGAGTLFELTIISVLECVKIFVYYGKES